MSAPVQLRLWESAERSGAFAVGPGSGWDPLAVLELTEDGPRRPAARCKSCHYLTTARGHAVRCAGGRQP